MRQLIPLITLFLFAFIHPCLGQGTASTLTKQPAKTVISFLKWYSENMDRLNGIALVNYPKDAVDEEGNVKDSSAFYTVNFKATEKWLAELKKSGFISNKYIARQRAYFRNCEKDFRTNHAYDGPPEGFDADLVLLSQDYDLSVLDESKAWVKMKTTKAATVTILFSYNELKLIYDLSNENGKWRIDGIKDGRE